MPHHSTFSENRLGRFRDTDILRFVFERVVRTCMARGRVKEEGFAVDASVMAADASRYHGVAPDELDWTEEQRQKGAVKDYLAALDETPLDPRRKMPKVISPSDPSSAWTAKANKRVQFGCAGAHARAIGDAEQHLGLERPGDRQEALDLVDTQDHRRPLRLA